jgi:exonuclease SbcC
MKLLGLRFNNFQSYKELDINLADLKLTSIIGKYENNEEKSNGSGKSSLLDGIIFALYGKSRSGNDDVIKRGTTQCKTELDFEILNSKYTIIRERGDRSVLTLLKDEENVSENIMATQEKINNILGLSYEMFIQTVFFQQNKNDTFTTSSSAERKSNLREILNLTLYESCLSKCKEKRKGFDDQKNTIDGKIQFIKEKIDNFKNEEQNKKLPDILKMKLMSQGKLLEYKEKQKEAELLINEQKIKKETSLKIKNEIEELNILLSKSILEKNNLIIVDLSKEDDSEYYKNQIEETRKLDQKSKLQHQEYTNKKKLYDSAEKEIHELISKIFLLKKDIENLEFFSLDKFETEEFYLKSINEKEKELENFDQNILTLLGRISKGEGIIDGLLERKNNQSKIESGICPVCNSELSSGQVDSLLKEIEDSLNSCLSKKTELESDLILLREERKKCNDSLNILKNESVNLINFKNKNESLKEKKILLENNLKEYKETLCSFDKKLEENKVDKSQVFPDYGLTLKKFEEMLEFVEKTKKQNELNEQKIIMLAEKCSDLNKRLEIKKEELKKYEFTENSEIRQFNFEIEEFEENIKKFEEEIILIERNIEEYKNNEEEMKNYEKELWLIKKEIQDYTILESVFGKNGIPNDIVKESLCELEEVTNRILKDLNSDFVVMFESEKELKSGEKRESLDIIIINGEHKASYETFSGGEKALINFSIRFSLSELLKKTNKTNINFLILDEIFGSLDNENTLLLINVLRYLKNQFQQIFVISHSELSRDTFENYILVQKNGETSKVIEIG